MDSNYYWAVKLLIIKWLCRNLEKNVSDSIAISISIKINKGDESRAFVDKIQFSDNNHIACLF